MEVLVGPTFTIDVAASPAPLYEKISSSSLMFIKEDEIGDGSDPRSPDDSSSSIGSPGDSDVEEVSSAGIGGLATLEDSLPIKRGLSNHYAGKSKSFTNLSDVSSVKEVPKVESPFNKRRRLLLANKWSRYKKSSFYSWQNPKSMPLLALVEDTEEAPPSSDDKTLSVKPKLHQSHLRDSVKSQSSFSLTDLNLQVEEEHH